MSYSAKQRIVVLLLVLMAAWPLAHRFVVPAMDLSPWKFFGWAMYCTPGRLIAVKVVLRDSGQALVLPPLDEQPERLRIAHARFDEYRRGIGRHCPPDDYARTLRELYSNIGAFEVVITEAELDRSTALVKQARKTTYRYDDEGRPES